MARINALYGLPRRAFSDSAILSAVEAVATNFDEAPSRMAAIVWRSDDLVWLAFESASLGPGRVLARDHFVESLVLLEKVPELVVIGRAYDEPNYFGHWVEGEQKTLLRAEGDKIVGALPEGTRMDGDVLDIGFRLTNLPLSRPFEAGGEPDAMVWMFREGERQHQVGFGAPEERLPVGVEMPLEKLPSTLPRHARRPLQASGADELVVPVSAALSWVQGSRRQANEIEARAQGLAELGHAVGPVVVDHLLEGQGGAPAFALGALALGRIGLPSTAPALTSTFKQGSRVKRATAFHALARMGEAARTAVEEGAGARGKKVREPCAALLQLLDGRAHARYREVRAAREAMDQAKNDEVRSLLTLWRPDISTEEFRARRDELLAKLDAAGVALLFGAAIDDDVHLDDFDLRMYIEAVAADALAPFAVAVVCAEHWLPDNVAANVPDRTKLKAAANQALGSKARRAAKTFALLPPD